MTAHTGSNYYQRGLELAECGQYQQGFHCIREHLRTTPHDHQALNDAGAILHCLGRNDDAIAYLHKARTLKPDSGEIVWNLVEAYLAAGRATEAVSLFDEMEHMGLLNIDVMNRTATVLLDQERKGQAVEVLLRSCQLWPEQDVLRPILDVIRSKRPKVAFFVNGTGEDGVAGEICEFVQQRFQTEFYGGPGSGSVRELMQWSDISWFDGCGELVVAAAQQREGCKTIVSLRRSDVCGRRVGKVRWENVDILVLIGSPAAEETLLEQVPNIRNRTRLVVIPNGVNLARYTVRPRQRGKNLVCMGRLSMEANPAFLLQCVQKLHYIDPEYRLFFLGSFESPVLEQYVRHMVDTLGLTSAVVFEPYSSDLNAWLGDKHFIVSGGIGEHQVEALLTGMACGLKPVIHNFPGAEKLFPSQHLFNIAEQFCEHVLCPEYEPEQYRQFVETRYAIEGQLSKVNEVLAQIESEIDLQMFAGLTEGRAGGPSSPSQQAQGYGIPGSDNSINL